LKEVMPVWNSSYLVVKSRDKMNVRERETVNPVP